MKRDVAMMFPKEKAPVWRGWIGCARAITEVMIKNNGVTGTHSSEFAEEVELGAAMDECPLPQNKKAFFCSIQNLTKECMGKVTKTFQSCYDSFATLLVKLPARSHKDNYKQLLAPLAALMKANEEGLTRRQEVQALEKQRAAIHGRAGRHGTQHKVSSRQLDVRGQGREQG
jgi:hypothetical protein